MLENIWGDYDHGSLHIAFGSTNNNNWESMNSSGWRTAFTPNLTYYVSIASELGALYSGFGNGYVPYNIVVGPGYQAYMVGNTFSAESQLTVHIDAALENFDLYPSNVPDIADMYFDEQQIIDLSNIFYNGTGSTATYDVYLNSDSEAITATVNGSDLVLDSNQKMTTTNLTIRATVREKESFVNLQIGTLDPALFQNLYESFEGSFEPTGWVLQTNNIGWTTTSDAYSGDYALVYPGTETDPQDDFIYTPKLTITGNAMLTFWEKTKYSAQGIHSIVETKDLGRYRPIEYNMPHSSNWQQTYVDLSEYDGQEIYIGFNYKFLGADVEDTNDIWYVDDVRLWTTTGIYSNEQLTIDNLQLEQNYPNPFNPTTEIKFRLESNSNVQLDVYNSKGEVVNSLVNSLMERGEHSISFNASELTGGIYFYKLNVDGVPSMTKKMLLLK